MAISKQKSLCLVLITRCTYSAGDHNWRVCVDKIAIPKPLQLNIEMNLHFDIRHSFDIQGQQFYHFCVRFQALVPLLFVHTVCRRAKLLCKCHNTRYHNKIPKNSVVLNMSCII